MTYEQMIKKIEALCYDASMCELGNGKIDVTIEDFEGFDEEWNEVEREFDNGEAVEAFLEMLENECTSKCGDFYVTYYFDGFEVEVGYASFDI